jgi:hypothetical protein
MSPSAMLRSIGGHLRPAATHQEQATPQPAAAPAALQLTHHLPQHDPAGATAAGTLSPAEVHFFKTNGFLIKRRLIPADVLAPFVDEFVTPRWSAALFLRLFHPQQCASKESWLTLEYAVTTAPTGVSAANACTPQWDTLRGPFNRDDPSSFLDAGQKWDNGKLAFIVSSTPPKFLAACGWVPVPVECSRNHPACPHTASLSTSSLPRLSVPWPAKHM